MKDIVDELRVEAEMHCLPDNKSVPLVTLLLNAAAEIERLRHNVSVIASPSFAEMVKDMKHHLRGTPDG